MSAIWRPFFARAAVEEVHAEREENERETAGDHNREDGRMAGDKRLQALHSDSLCGDNYSRHE